MAAPTRYNEALHPVQAREYCEAGATIADLASHFGVSKRTINNWAKAHQEFCEALKAGRGVADDMVEHAFFNRCLGFDYDESTTVTETKEEPVVSTEGQVVATQVTTITRKAKSTKRVAGDVDAQKFWLTNRRPADWKNKHDLEHSGTVNANVALEGLEELLKLDVRELARMHSEALAESEPAQPEP